MTGYELTQKWYEFKIENPKRVRPIHSDMFFYLVYLWNKLGKKQEFGLPTDLTMEALGIGSYNTYKGTFDDLVEFGAVKLIKDSKNQHHAKIIALSFIDKAIDEANDKAGDKPNDEANDNPINKANGLSKNDEASAKAGDNASAKATDTIIKVENLLNNKNFNSSSSSSTGGEKENFKSQNPVTETPPDSGAPPSYDWNNLRDVLLADAGFVQWALFTLKVSKAELEDVILEYIYEQHSRNKPLNRDYNDLKSHVVNYGRKMKAAKDSEKSKNPNHGNYSNHRRNSQNSGPTAIIPRDEIDY